MNRTINIEMTRRQLMRIVALLLGLAALADRACRLPRPARALAMMFLRQADSVARAFVAGEAEAPALIPGPADDVVDAARLAGSFRALAMTLASLAARLLARREDRIGIVPARVPRHLSVVPKRMWGPRVSTLPIFDTS